MVIIQTDQAENNQADQADQADQIGAESENNKITINNIIDNDEQDKKYKKF
jgi:hypothetical protein